MRELSLGVLLLSCFVACGSDDDSGGSSGGAGGSGGATGGSGGATGGSSATGGSGVTGGSGGAQSCPTTIELCVNGKLESSTCDPCVTIDCDMPGNYVVCGDGSCVLTGQSCPDAGGADVATDASDAGAD